MDVIYGLIPLMILLGLFMVGLFIWTVRNGQYDDLDGDANRILMDDDDPPSAGQRKKQNSKDDVEKGDDARNWPDAD